MAHDVFISHSSKDKVVADATCAFLEARGIRCWVAPRDIRPGANWGSSIIEAIRSSRVMVLIFSGHANSSPQIDREVERAVHFGVTVIPMRIENVAPSGDLEYFLGVPHWLDAFNQPLETYLDSLARVVKEILATPAPAKVTEAEPAPTLLVVPPVSEPSPLPAPASTPIPPVAAAPVPVSSSPVVPPPSAKSSGLGLWMGLGGVALLLLIVAAAVGYFFAVGGKSPPPEAASESVSTPAKADDAEAVLKKAQQDLEKPSANDRAAQAAALLAPAVTASSPTSGPVAGQPWTNSLGVKFVPAGSDNVLFAVWDVRVKDFAAFVDATNYDATEGMFSPGIEGWRQRGATWKSPGFDQTDDCPVVGISWDDAHAFCAWLTKKEKAAGTLSSQEYRLPTDAEWSKAVGLDESSEGSPGRKSMQILDVYPWGTQWPPPAGAGNYLGSEALGGKLPATFEFMDGYNDGFPRTSPVGSFAANKYGLYDMGGNVWQLCEDSLNPGGPFRVMRGASWVNGKQKMLLSSARASVDPSRRSGHFGFRIVLQVAP